MRTKIVCTIGPSSEKDDVLREMIRAGMDVARLNFSHGTHADHARRLALVRRVADEEGQLVAVMGDLQGPKFRLGELPKEGVPLERGQPVLLATAAPAGQHVCLPMPHPELLRAMQPGQRVLIDDGTFALRVIDKPAEDVAHCVVLNGGVITSRKGVSLPGASIAVSSITPKDRLDLAFAIEHGMDAIALSFVRSAEDLRELRSLIAGLAPDPLRRPYVVAKIEKPEAVHDLSNILRETDIVMVARGDLGVESSPQDVPFFQKRIIRACLRAGKPVITATQMLQSMITTPVPTRAEASDVANAVLDGTDAVMTSAETATGQYPVETVRVMQTICSRAEDDESMWSDLAIEREAQEASRISGPDDVTEAITHAAVAIADEVNARAVVCLTSSGHTARMVARHRPRRAVVALTPIERTRRLTAFIWDVQGFHLSQESNAETMFENAGRLVREHGLANPGERVVLIAGVPLGRGSGHTNLIKVQEV